jgi:hypothetical protein
MFSGKYGPFANIMLVLTVLSTVFSAVLMRAVGRVSQWTYLADDTPNFVVTAASRALAIVLIVLAFIFIDKSNYRWFLVPAAIFAFLMTLLIVWFDRLRRAHFCKVPLLNEDGSQKKGWFGSPKFRTVVIGSENNMKVQAAAAYRKFGAGSLCKFLSGYGQNELNNAEAIWTKETLAKIGSKMTMLLIGIFLCAVMALYLAASVLEVHQRPAPISGIERQPQSSASRNVSSAARALGLPATLTERADDVIETG